MKNPKPTDCALLAALFLAIPLFAGCTARTSPDRETTNAVQDAPDETLPAEETSSSKQKNTVCAGCHEDHYTLWLYGGHRTISCEFCHGPAGDHVREDIVPRPKTTILSDPRLCLACHGRSGKSDEGKAPQIVGFEAHMKYVGSKHTVSIDLEKTGRKCTYCHDPHSLE